MKLFLFKAILGSLLAVVFGENGPKDKVARCCSALSPVNAYISFPNSPIYINQTTGSLAYWSSLESDLAPACRFSPPSTTDLSLGIKILSSNKCQFAIRSGGHMQFPGASNYDGKGKDGVTIDMNSINQIEVLDSWTQKGVVRHEKVAKIGSGARWAEVYAKMDPLGLTVPGGRVDSVGVGGFLLGGGLSIFAHTTGFACNYVLQYEVVLGNGTVGHNNLGAVSSFTMKTIPIPNGIWGGIAISDASYVNQAYEALYNFGDIAGRDGLTTDIAGATSLLYFNAPSTETKFISNFITSSTGVIAPSILSNFTAIPQLSNTFRKTTLGDIITEVSGSWVNGHRQLLGEVTFKNNVQIMKEAQRIFEEGFAPFANVKGFQQIFIVQPLHRAILAANEKMGGNILGLGAKDGNTVWFAIILSWDDTSSDKAINAAAKKFFADVNQTAKRLGVYHPYVYLNYASEFQDPISSYGEVNVQKLRAASRKYDPDQVFQKLVPGGFKIPGGRGGDDDDSMHHGH
ncbi:FAD-binding domain-containing protein [Cadophora sp. DSE1049]|nr:FAD-binding domain-containing protein [Cadophora sp. DSE1049]